MSAAAETLAHWPLEVDAGEARGGGLGATIQEIQFDIVDGRRAAKFNGSGSKMVVPSEALPKLGAGEFAIALWVYCAAGDIVGDLVNKFDHDARRGFHLMVQTQTGMTQTTQSNYRHLQFGIDNAQAEVGWNDCGRPGNAVNVASMASIEGDLYVGTFENAPNQSGHLMRYRGETDWEDLGAAPPGCNYVGSVIYHNGDIYAATGRYDPNGSLLGNARNTRPGGNVYRIENGEWVDCGVPGLEGAAPEDEPNRYNEYHTDKADFTACLTSYRGELLAVSHHRHGVHRYLGDRRWTMVGPAHRIMSLTIHEGNLLALVNGSGVYRYEADDQWTYCGDPPGSTQTYGAVTYQGQLYVGSWPECEVIRYEGGAEWTTIGRVGYEREVMATALVNGKCYFGTLPMANVFRMDGSDFTYMGNLDNDPDYYLRRVWSMAVHKGRLYAGTLPSGRVWSRQFGVMATHDHVLAPGWRHIAAVRERDQLKLYLDGQLVCTSSRFSPDDYSLDNDQPLRIGHGIGHNLHGAVSDLRLYNEALCADAVSKLGNTN
jgi:hypothetical protein